MEKMKVLVIGSGGREHALAWKLGQSKMVSEVFAAPGNPLWQGITSVDLTDLQKLADFAEKNKIGFTMVGPEIPLCDGIVDIFRAKGLKIFGPDKFAAQLEGSKAFAKDFMFRHKIPTAESKTFTDATSALKFLQTKTAPIVIKADGLAAGKGVIVAEKMEDAIAGVKSCFTGFFGVAGERIVIEDFLAGEEASILAFVDGKTIKPLASSQDHKRRFENDLGPNTGGMGAYSPAPVVDDEMWKKIDVQVLQPFLAGCQKDNLNFRGIIFIGIMVSPECEPKVLEFNVRFGDPETEAVLLRMENDLLEAMLATVDGKLETIDFQWSKKHSVCVVIASNGYPENYEKGKKISGITEAERCGVKVFQAGTKAENGEPVSNGGRVLVVSALGENVKKAVDLAYESIGNIQMDGMVFRKDIAYRALSR